MALDTMYVCYCEDYEKNDGISKPYFMSRGLMEFMQKMKSAAGGGHIFAKQSDGGEAGEVIPLSSLKYRNEL